MKSFLHAKKSLASPGLGGPPGCVAGRSLAKIPLPGGSGAVRQAEVEVVKEGDKVMRLVVTCSCGERIEVECLYSAGA